MIFAISHVVMNHATYPQIVSVVVVFFYSMHAIVTSLKSQCSSEI